MKSIGDILKHERLKKKLTIDQISIETNIPRYYLQALENNHFDKMPGGESSFLGFLRMYALFLDIEVDKVLLTYKNHKIVEEQTPYEALLKKDFNWKKLMIVSFMSMIVFLSTAFFINSFLNVSFYRSVKYVTLFGFKERAVKKTVRLNQILSLLIDGHTYTIKFKKNSLGEVEGLISGAERQQEFILTSNESFSIVLNVLSTEIENPSTLYLKLDKLINNKKILISLKVESYPVVETDDLISVLDTKEYSHTNITSDLSNSLVQQRQTLMSVRTGVPVNPTIIFKGYVYYRHRLDNSEVTENYFQSGDQLQRTMHSSMKIWSSNAGRTSVKIGLNEVVLGKDGEVVVKLLYWQRNHTTGMIDLILESV